MGIFVREKWAVGVDMGGENVKIIVMSKNEKPSQLIAHAFFKKNNLQGIREALRHPAVRSGSIRVSIDDPSMKIRKLNLPPAPLEELSEIGKWGFKEVLGGAVEDYVFRFRPLPLKAHSKEIPYLGFAIQKERLNQFVQGLKMLGITRPEIVEPKAHALVMDLIHNREIEKDKNKVVALVDWGATCVLFMVVGSEGLLFSRPLGGLSGETLTKQISRDLGCTNDVAEKLKTDGATHLQKEKEGLLKNTLSHFFSKAVVEIQRSIDAYAMQFTDQQVAVLLFTGGGSRLSGLQTHIAEALRLPVEQLKPFQRIDLGEFRSENLMEKELYYGVATGLAL